MPKAIKVQGGFSVSHTTREVWGVDDDSECPNHRAKYNPACPTCKSILAQVDAAISQNETAGNRKQKPTC